MATVTKLTELDALRAYARTMNTLDASHIEPLLDENFRYSSQWMAEEFASKQECLDYLQPMLDPDLPSRIAPQPRRAMQ